MAVVMGILLVFFGLVFLWAVWRAHVGFWQDPRSERPPARRTTRPYDDDDP